MSATSQPQQCRMCGGYLTMDEGYSSRCVDPGHWLAAGLLEQNDFYAMAQLVASGRSRPLKPAAQPVALAFSRPNPGNWGNAWSTTGLRHFLLKFCK